MDILGGGHVNYPELIITQYIHKSKHHIVPHNMYKCYMLIQNEIITK
jgi:hypothetical protein